MSSTRRSDIFILKGTSGILAGSICVLVKFATRVNAKRDLVDENIISQGKKISHLKLKHQIPTMPSKQHNIILYCVNVSIL